MQGIYRSPEEDSFITDEALRREQQFREVSDRAKPPEFITPIPQTKCFDYWSQRLIERQRIYMETAQNPNNLEIQFHDDTLLAFISDIHLGSAYTDYQRLEAEVEAIVGTPNAYVWFLGDIVDAFFWMPANQDDIENVQEQYEYAQSLFKYLADHQKLIIGTAGNHDMWIKKSGVNPYTHFTEQTGAYFTHGTTYLTARVVNESYKITGGHQFLGRSYLNPNHSQGRAYRSEGAMGSDVVVSGHYHTKGIQETAFPGYNGTSQKVTMIALGAYKPEDEFTRTKGFAYRDSNAMYGACVTLSRDGHVQPYYDILDGVDKFKMEQAWKIK
jgi:UDP-2,3-diacylglucosamine pyrophosphatase LpxH